MRNPIWYLSAALIIFGILARLWNFSSPSFSPDEAMLVTRAVSVSRGLSDLVKREDTKTAAANIFLPILKHNHAPLEFLVLIPAVPFENRELFGRLVYVLISIFTLLGSYMWLKKLEGVKVAFVFLLLTSTSAYVIWMGQTAMAMGLAFTAGVFLALSQISYVTKPNLKNFLRLSFIFALSILTFQDFIFYLPALLLLIWHKTKSKYQILKFLAITFLVSGIFYVPYILYGLFDAPKNVGFNYVIYEKLSGNVDVLKNIKGYLHNYFLASGVITIWPLAFVYYTNRKKPSYAKYFYLTISIYLLVLILKSTTPFFYFISIWGLLGLLTAKHLSTFSLKTYSLFLVIIFSINFLGFKSIFNGVNNPFIFGAKKDDIKSVGKIIKSCNLTKSETYLSTQNPWKTSYYFGKSSLYEADGDENRLQLIYDFVNKPNSSVVAVHVDRINLNREKISKLYLVSPKTYDFKYETLFILKSCKI